MEKLLDDLLAYSRAERQQSEPEWVDLRLLVRSITDLIAPPGFTVIVADTLPVLYVERIPLETTLRNVIDNAIKHHDRPQHGRVEVAMREQAGMIEFTIADNGPGIASEFHQWIFSMFQTLKPRDQVEGVGLAIVKKIVERRGGVITVNSSEGAGAIFLLYLAPEANCKRSVK